jgi:hypothetical protein
MLHFFKTMMVLAGKVAAARGINKDGLEGLRVKLHYQKLMEGGRLQTDGSRKLSECNQHPRSLRILQVP